MRGEPLLVWGAGGHGRVVADVVRAAGGVVVGFVDGDPSRLGSPVDGGGSILFGEEALLAHLAEHGALPAGAAGVAPGIGSNAVRARLLARLGPFAAGPLVHPAAWVSPSASLGRGTVVMAGAVVNAGARVGEGVIVNTGAVVEHDCRVGDGVHLSPRATLCGAVEVGEGSWVCAGATVIPGVRVGARATVGAGAVALRDVADDTTVAGCPAREIKKGR
ncbi:MAG TPA: acetyltransferase [Longimicrobiaceae bacterium]